MYYCEGNLIAQLDRSVSVSKHREMLLQIKARGGEKLNKSLPIIKSRTKANLEKEKEINRLNAMIKNKLLTITGKITGKDATSSLSSVRIRPSKHRKLEAKRIEIENKFMAQRIESNSSVLSASKLKMEYSKYEKISQNLSKIKRQNRIKKLLQPIIK